MTQPDVGPEMRRYGMMQHLLTVAAQGRLPESAPDRHVVTRDDALDASLQHAAVIDEATQAGRWPAEQGVHGAAMLMIIREYIKSLPPGPMPDGTDGAADDLTELVKLIRQQHGESGVQG
jgi:hypothetical protein